MKFTDRKLLGLKPKAHSYDLREQDGFVIRTYPTGRKTFQFVFRKEGKERRVSIGEYPRVFTLAEAREKHAELYRALKRGEDPARKQAVDGLTVKRLAGRFLTEYVKRENIERTYKNRKMQLEKDIYPVIGKKVAVEVSRSDVIACLKRHKGNGSATGHNHLLGTIKKMFNWAIENELVENNPAYMIKLMSTTPRQTLLSDSDMRGILSTRDTDSAKILQFCLYTGCRPGEARDIKHEDIERKWWTCKQNKGGTVSYKRTYLIPAALELVGEGKGKVFTGLNHQPGLSQYVQRKYGSGWQPRDIRRTVSTTLRKMGFNKDVVSSLLGHSRGVLLDTYQLYEYDTEKKEMLEAWEKKVLEI